MGNRIASAFIQSLRSSLTGTTVYSQTSADRPLFVDPTTLPGVARAWVTFSGMHQAGQRCTILSSSTNIEGVTARGVGDYRIGFRTNTFGVTGYVVTGSIVCRDRLNPVSAANSFFIMDPAFRSGVRYNTSEVAIQTYYAPASAGVLYTGPAYANIVSLAFFK